MALRHAANRFRKTWVDGWNGKTWIPKVARGSLSSYIRPLSDNPLGMKLRNFLLDPDEPLIYSVVRISSTTETYLVCDQATDCADTIYSQVALLRRAAYACEVYKAVAQTAASGFSAASMRVLTGTYACDRVSAASLASPYPNLNLSEERVILPADVLITRDHELVIENRIYDVEDIYEEYGLTICRCVVHK